MCFKNKVIIKPPVEVIPTFKTWIVPRFYFVRLCEENGIKPSQLLPNSVLYSKVRYTTLESTDILLQDLMPHLPPNSADWTQYCYYQAQAAFVKCVERYRINALATVLDLRLELEKPNAHAYNIIAYGNETGLNGLLLFEPNSGYEWSGIVPFGEHNYKPEIVLI